MAKIEEVDVNMRAQEVDPNLQKYYDPKKVKKFSVEGLGYFDKEKEYFRLPIGCKDKVTDSVYWLAAQPAGGQIRFRTNAKRITIKVKNHGDYQMCHMAATGQQGVDLYYKLKGQRTYTFFTCAKFEEPTTEFESIMFEADEKMDKEIILNLPLYEGLKEILIGVEQDAYIAKPKKHKLPGRIVVYGTSITQGGCASRPGMAYTNILSRRLDVEFINLGFSGSGLGEPELAHLINEIKDVRMLVLDYDANGGATGDLIKNMDNFIDIFRSLHPTEPILVVTKPPFSNYVFKKQEIDHRQRLFDFQYNVVKNHQVAGDQNIYFLDGNTVFGKEDIYESTVDGLHPTDLGFYRMAKEFYPVLKKLLKK